MRRFLTASLTVVLVVAPSGVATASDDGSVH